MKENIYEVESEIDKWLSDNLYESIPSNKYIYYCNLSYIDIVVDQKVLFTKFKKHYLSEKPKTFSNISDLAKY